MLQIVWRDMCRFIQPYVIITIEMRHRNNFVSQFYIKLRNQNTDSNSVFIYLIVDYHSRNVYSYEFIESYQLSTSKILHYFYSEIFAT